MALTPVEIRHLQLGRGLLGYGRRSVDPLLEEIAESFEDVWRERADLADRSRSSRPTSSATASSRGCSGRRSSRPRAPRRS